MPSSKLEPNRLATTSDLSSHYTPEFTPSSTPSGDPPAESLDTGGMDESKIEEPGAKDETQVDTGKETKTEVAKEAGSTSEAKNTRRNTCKKHSKSKAKSKCKSEKETSSDSDSAASTSGDESSSGGEHSDDSEDETSEDERAAKKQKKKPKKKLALKKKARRRAKRAAATSSDESSDEDPSSSEEEVRSKRKSKKSKESRRVEDSDDEEEDYDDDDAVQTEAELRRAAMARRLRTRQQLNKKQSGRSAGEKSKKKKKTKKSKKASSKPQYFRADELWDRQIHAYKLQETAAAADEDEYGEYIFHVRRRFDWEGKYADTVVDIKSKTLRNSLQTIMGNCKAVSLAEDTPCIDPNMLFLYLEDIRTHHKEVKAKSKSEKKKKARKAAGERVSQLKCLLKYLDKDYASTKKTLYPLLEAGNITFELLWTLFRSDTIIYTSTYSAPDEPRAFKVEYATKECSFMKGTWYDIEGRYMDFDGKNFGLGTMNVEIEAFKGPRRISSLPCYPIKYHKDPDAIEKQLKERGKKFVSLAGMKYKSHVGLGFMKKKRQVLKVSTNSRVMLDPSTFRRINPNYPISTVKPQDPDFLPENDDDGEGGACSCCEQDGDDGRANEPLADADTPKYRMKLVVDKDDNPHIIEVEVDENGNEVQKESVVKLPNGEDGAVKREFTEEELLVASPVILGFAFSEKMWLEFTVSGIQDIEWNEGAFDSLVLPDNQKSIVKALVQSHTSEAQERKTIDDVIKGKGKGLVAVLHGSPGVGKTLTAEGIAELLKCPLYSVSAGELGTNPRELEQELTKILDVAHSWGAVLLLDEADVFLEARTAQDIHRNALVSIFLRVLEYFQGILFLTTNRVSSFDDAFQSRIHIALRVRVRCRSLRALLTPFPVPRTRFQGAPCHLQDVPRPRRCFRCRLRVRNISACRRVDRPYY